MYKVGDKAIWVNPWAKDFKNYGKVYLVIDRREHNFFTTPKEIHVDTINSWPPEYWIDVKTLTKLERLVYGCKD